MKIVNKYNSDRDRHQRPGVCGGRQQQTRHKTSEKVLKPFEYKPLENPVYNGLMRWKMRGEWKPKYTIHTTLHNEAWSWGVKMKILNENKNTMQTHVGRTCILLVRIWKSSGKVKTHIKRAR